MRLIAIALGALAASSIAGAQAILPGYTNLYVDGAGTRLGGNVEVENSGIGDVRSFSTAPGQEQSSLQSYGTPASYIAGLGYSYTVVNEFSGSEYVPIAYRNGNPGSQAERLGPLATTRERVRVFGTYGFDRAIGAQVTGTKSFASAWTGLVPREFAAAASYESSNATGIRQSGASYVYYGTLKQGGRERAWWSTDDGATFRQFAVPDASRDYYFTGFAGSVFQVGNESNAREFVIWNPDGSIRRTYSRAGYEVRAVGLSSGPNGTEAYFSEFSYAPSGNTVRSYALSVLDGTLRELTIPGYQLQLDQVSLNGIATGTAYDADGNFGGVWSTYQPVPEPATLAVLGLGALALLRRRRI